MLISGVTPINKKATRSVAQTLTCKIDNIKEEPRNVGWRDPQGEVIIADTKGYSINSGAMTMKTELENDAFIQETTLTISPSLLKKHAPNSVVKYGCSAWTSEYKDEEKGLMPSDLIPTGVKKHDVIVTFLTMSEYNFVTRIKNMKKSITNNGDGKSWGSVANFEWLNF